jgi:hypothetical protein
MLVNNRHGQLSITRPCVLWCSILRVSMRQGALAHAALAHGVVLSSLACISLDTAHVICAPRRIACRTLVLIHSSIARHAARCSRRRIRAVGKACSSRVLLGTCNKGSAAGAVVRAQVHEGDAPHLHRGRGPCGDDQKRVFSRLALRKHADGHRRLGHTLLPTVLERTLSLPPSSAPRSVADGNVGNVVAPSLRRVSGMIVIVSAVLYSGAEPNSQATTDS